jgi:FkbM family methyltransferase
MITLKDCLRVLRREYHIRAGKSPNAHVQVKIKKERHGSDYGGWVIKSDSINSNSIVYSFGIGNDITFDLSIIQKYHVNVFAFDPTPQVKDWLDKQNLPVQFIYKGMALSDEDGVMRFYKPANPDYISHSCVQINEEGDFFEVPAQRLQTIMKELGHTHIDIFKIDIEGAEYPVIRDILSSGIKINQILVEFHHFFNAFSKTDTESTIALMNRHNYKIFSISPNGFEYSFIKE